MHANFILYFCNALETYKLKIAFNIDLVKICFLIRKKSIIPIHYLKFILPNILNLLNCFLRDGPKENHFQAKKICILRQNYMLQAVCRLKYANNFLRYTNYTLSKNRL